MNYAQTHVFNVGTGEAGGGTGGGARIHPALGKGLRLLGAATTFITLLDPKLLAHRTSKIQTYPYFYPLHPPCSQAPYEIRHGATISDAAATAVTADPL